MFEFQEKEQFTLQEVQELVEGFKGEANQLISAKDTEIAGLNESLQGFEDLKKSNHELQIKSLMVAEGIEENLFDLVKDEDIELAKNKITLLKDNVTSKTNTNNYIPKNSKKDDDISKLEKEGNVEGMLKHKLGRLFG